MSNFENPLISIINVFVTVISIFLFAILTILSYKRKESDLNPEIILPTNSEVIKVTTGGIVRPTDVVAGGMDQNGMLIYVGQVLFESKIIPRKIYTVTEKCILSGSERIKRLKMLRLKLAIQKRSVLVSGDMHYSLTEKFNGTSVSMKQLASRCSVVITEQPAPGAVRFRYECEGRFAGSIPGISSSPQKTTYPAIRITGYQGRALVIVSCVTKDEPYRPHPHNLVGKEGCKKGVCTLQIPPETMSVAFPNLGIQCAKRKDIAAALKLRQEIKVDPFRTGFKHSESSANIDLNAVRLCFQVFLEYEGKFAVPLAPIVTEPIYDKKAISSLTIVKLSDNASSVDGGDKDVIILCDKVAKEDIAVRFFEEIGDRLMWEAIITISPFQVHKKTAIWFRPPCYKTVDITEAVDVFVQLLRPSDGATSEAMPFKLLPLGLDSHGSKRKRQRIRSSKLQMDISNRVLAPLDNHENNDYSNEGEYMYVTPPTNNVNIPYNTHGQSSDLDVPLDLSKWMDITPNVRLQEISLSSGELSNLSARLSDSLSLSRKL